jgi:redox-sensing transcriptional repressor
VTEELIDSIDAQLSGGTICRAVIVGAGKLGGALLGYDGFSSYGLTVVAAFDKDRARSGEKKVLPMEELETFCRQENVRIGVITVPAAAAQEVCDRLVAAGVRAIWSFAPVRLSVPDGVALREEDLALSLAHLRVSSMAEDL